MLVQAILKSKATDGVVTVEPTATVSEAAKILAEKRMGTVIVSEDGPGTLGTRSGRYGYGQCEERRCVSEGL